MTIWAFFRLQIICLYGHFYGIRLTRRFFSPGDVLHSLAWRTQASLVSGLPFCTQKSAFCISLQILWRQVRLSSSESPRDCATLSRLRTLFAGGLSDRPGCIQAD